VGLQHVFTEAWPVISESLLYLENTRFFYEMSTGDGGPENKFDR